jgi:hypothetical protein
MANSHRQWPSLAQLLVDLVDMGRRPAPFFKQDTNRQPASVCKDFPTHGPEAGGLARWTCRNNESI